MPDTLNEAILKEILQDRPFQFFPQVDSTNDIAQQWILEGAPTGAVVIAEEQLAGRGRLARKWYTPPKQAIAMSVIVRLEDVQFLSRIMMAAAIAVAESLRNYTHGITLKWPNDVLLNGKKVCGILAESQWAGDLFLGAIIGIGLNVRVSFADTELAERATSLEDHTNKSVKRAHLIASILENLDRWLALLRSDKLLAAYRENLITLGQEVSISVGNKIITGRAIDIDGEGALLIELPDGVYQKITVGEVR